MTLHTRAPTSSPIEDDPPHLLANYPPIFVLPTRLTLDELHALEDDLGKLDATLTYDVTEARIVLGTIAQRKRAALELRARGVWTEEVPVPVPVSVSGPSALAEGSVGDGLSKATVKRQRQRRKEAADSPSPKRRRLSSSKDGEESRTQSQERDVVDLSTESESEGEGEGARSRSQSTVHHERQQRRRRLSRSSDGTNTTVGDYHDEKEDASIDKIVEHGHVKVVRLEWAIQSIKARKVLDIDKFVVYHGKVIAPPQSTATATTTTVLKSVKTQSEDGQGILARAIGDAASKPLPSARPPYFSRVSSTTRGAVSQHQHPPPTLYRQTTSEHDQTHLIPPAPDWVTNGVLYACMRSAPLHPPNEAFISQLVKIRKVRELTLDEIGVRAYSTSIAAVAAYPYELRSPVEILSLPGCDTKIANLFVEFRNNDDGKIEAAEALETDPVISTIYQFHNIWGVGPKTAREFYYQRQWRDLDDVIEQGWNSLSRVQQIGLKYYDEFLAGVPRSEVSDIAKIIHRHARLVRPGSDYDGQGIECILVGGYRRGKEMQGDIDLVLSHRDERVTKNLVIDIVSSLETEGWITHTLALHMTSSSREQQTLPFRGDPGAHHFDSLDKALVVWQDPHFQGEAEPDAEDSDRGSASPAPAQKVKNPNPHRRVDIIISPWRTVGCAVLGWSGDTTFERDLRRYAKKKHGWKFDSSGVRERMTGGSVIDLEGSGSTWEERERLVMEGLGVGWRPASERCTK
jgi:DNA polymerase IV